MKTCYVCKVSKPHSEYYKSKNRADGLNSRCKPCQIAYNKSRYDKNPEMFKMKRIASRYGISAEKYAEMTKNGCEVCGTFENLFVDHDHSCCPHNRNVNTCGKCVRGILCRSCNTAEGYLKGSPDLAMKLALYMRKNK